MKDRLPNEKVKQFQQPWMEFLCPVTGTEVEEEKLKINLV
jgi:hypothetical protein